MMPDYAWWEQHGRAVKARLTKLERLCKSQPQYVLAEVAKVRAQMDEHGYPDWWSRIDRLEQDAIAYERWS